MIIKTFSISSEKDLQDIIDNRVLLSGKIISVLLLTVNLSQKFNPFIFMFILTSFIFSMIIYFKREKNFGAFIFLLLGIYIPYFRIENPYPFSDIFSIIIIFLVIAIIFISIWFFNEYQIQRLKYEVNEQFSLRIIWLKLNIKYIIRILGFGLLLLLVSIGYKSEGTNVGVINRIIEFIISIGGIFFFYLLWIYSKEMSERFFELFFFGMYNNFSYKEFNNKLKDFRYNWSIYYYIIYLTLVIIVLLR